MPFENIYPCSILPNFLRQIFIDLWRHKLRSFLALLCIFSGTATVILLLAIGEGFRIHSEKNVFSIVDGTLFVSPGTVSQSFLGLPAGRKINIKANTIAILPRILPSIKLVSPMLTDTLSLSANNKKIQKLVYGVNDSYFTLRKLSITPGSRFLNAIDIKNHTFTVIIGDKIKTLLFGNKPALNKKIFIKNVPFLVIGIIQTSNKSAYNWHSDSVLIPYSTYISIQGNKNISYFIAFPDPKLYPSQSETILKNFLAARFNFSPGDIGALNIINTTKIYQFIKWFFVGLQIFLGICGSLTLIVAGVGVANIMFLIVTERTKEIGIRRAIGATDSKIMVQILLQTFVVIIIGGLAGFIFSYLLIALTQFISLPDWLGKPTLSLYVVFITISILAIVGVISGYFPAKKAMLMDPVEALSR
jgi:putative ABC transport system permease protein